MKRTAEGGAWGRVEGAWKANGPPGGWVWGRRGKPPGKSAGKGLGRKEWRAQGGWGVGAGLGGERAECARGSSLATPTPGPGPPAPRPTGRTPAGEPRSRLSGFRVRRGDHSEFCFCLDGCPGSGNVASLRALRLSGSAARTHGWKVGLYSGKMTSPAGTQNQEIDCLSPEAQRLVRGTRGSVLCLSVPPSPRRAVSPEGSMVKGSGPLGDCDPAGTEAGGLCHSL